MQFLILSKNNYLSEFLSVNTEYKVKSFESLAEFFLEMKNQSSDMVIIDNDPDFAKELAISYRLLNIISISNKTIENINNLICLIKPINVHVFLQIVESEYKKNKKIKLNDKWYLINNSRSLYSLEENKKILITEREYMIISLLLKYKPVFITKQQILEEIWRHNEQIDTHTLETHIYRLRQKIGSNSKLIINKNGGYSLA